MSPEHPGVCTLLIRLPLDRPLVAQASLFCISPFDLHFLPHQLTFSTCSQSTAATPLPEPRHCYFPSKRNGKVFPSQVTFPVTSLNSPVSKRLQAPSDLNFSTTPGLT